MSNIVRDVVLVVSTSQIECDKLCGMLENQENIELHRMVANGTSRFDDDTQPNPKLVILDLGEQASQMLHDWDLHSKTYRAPMIVVGPANDNALMRRAMQGGARDYFTRPLMADEFIHSVRQVLRETAEVSEKSSGGHLTAVINAKGGSGASLIACNLAHILAVHLNKKTALIDMDLQFGALPLALDLKVRDSLFDVISASDRLDPIALKGYMTEHASGLAVLGAMTDQLVMPSEVEPDAVQRVLDVALQAYEHVVVDLTRQIDPLNSMVLRRADRVLILMQQGFAHLRDTKRMNSLLLGYLGIPKDRLTLVVNRYSDKDVIRIEDIQGAIQPMKILTIPNDYQHVSESLNLGIPLYQGERNIPITEKLCELARHVAGMKPQVQESTSSNRRFKNIFGLAGGA